jgi:hypothetical protein
MQGGIALVFLEADRSESARAVADEVWAAFEAAIPSLRVVDGRIYAEQSTVADLETLMRRLGELGWATPVPLDEPAP